MKVLKLYLLRLARNLQKNRDQPVSRIHEGKLLSITLKKNT